MSYKKLYEINLKDEMTNELYRRLKYLMSANKEIKQLIIELISRKEKDALKLRDIMIDMNIWSK